MSNTYWPIYKDLEKELIEISRIIRGCDEQLNVYSDKILELLIRCAIEIESISKELFFLNGGAKPQDRDLYFDTDCINLLEDKWKLSKKKLIISCSNFYLVKDENRTIVPLKKANKRGTSGSGWKKAYQAVKHDRKNNMKMANIKHLIGALGALYILNLYYKDETFNINNTNDDRFQYSLSDIFSFSIHSFNTTESII